MEHEFNTEFKLLGHHALSNRQLTIAVIESDLFQLLQEKELLPVTETPYTLENLKWHSQLLRELREDNQYGIPDKMYVLPCSFAVFIWGTKMYLIAPRTGADSDLILFEKERDKFLAVLAELKKTISKIQACKDCE